jgi:uncharacterized protein
MPDPRMSDLLVPILVGLTFLVAGAVKGVIGLGLPTVAIGLLVMVMTPAQAAATGVFAIPSVPYLQALGLDKDALVQALGLSFTVATLALGADLVRAGVLEGATAATSLAALAPALIGMALGQWLRNRIRSELFRVCFLVALIVLGSHLLLRAAL